LLQKDGKKEKMEGKKNKEIKTNDKKSKET
jgi:hypothetical protein